MSNDLIIKDELVTQDNIDELAELIDIKCYV